MSKQQLFNYIDIERIFIFPGHCSPSIDVVKAELSPKNITLPNYPQSTHKYDRCWTMDSWSKPFKLIFRTFDLTPADYLSISDNSREHTRLGYRILFSPRFYGLNPPPPVIYSMSSVVSVHLRGETLLKPSRNYSGLWIEYSTFKPGKNHFGFEKMSAKAMAFQGTKTIFSCVTICSGHKSHIFRTSESKGKKH